MSGRGLRGFLLQIQVYKFTILQTPNASRITPWLPKRVLLIVCTLYYVYIVVEATLNRAEYGSQRSDLPKNVNFEPIIRGLKSDNFNWDQVWKMKIRFIYVRFNCKRKSEVKNGCKLQDCWYLRLLPESWVLQNFEHISGLQTKCMKDDFETF